MKSALPALLNITIAGLTPRTCFAAGTPLLTPDGSKPIDEFKVGDLLLSAPDDDPSAPVQPRRVEEIFTRVSPLIEVRVRGQVIRANKGVRNRKQRFLTPLTWPTFDLAAT